MGDLAWGRRWSSEAQPWSRPRGGARFLECGTAFLLALAVVVLVPAPARAGDPCDSPPSLSDFNNRFAVRRPIAATGTDGVAQGMDYWPQADALVSAHYRNDGSGPNFLAISPRTGTTYKRVYIRDLSGNWLTGHMGGLAIGPSYAYISSSHGSYNLWKVPLSALSTAVNGGSVRAVARWNVRASSFSTYYDGQLYVGTFSTSASQAVYRYSVNSSGNLDPALWSSSWSAPTSTQGIAYADGRWYYSRSYGRCSYSTISVRNATTGGWVRHVRAPSMSEGIAHVSLGRSGWVDDEVFVVFESGSSVYLGCSHSWSMCKYRSARLTAF